MGNHGHNCLLDLVDSVLLSYSALLGVGEPEVEAQLESEGLEAVDIGELAGVSWVKVIDSSDDWVIPGWDEALGIRRSQPVLGWDEVLHWLSCLISCGVWAAGNVFANCIFISVSVCSTGYYVISIADVLVVRNSLMVPVCLEGLWSLREVR